MWAMQWHGLCYAFRAHLHAEVGSQQSMRWAALAWHSAPAHQQHEQRLGLPSIFWPQPLQRAGCHMSGMVLLSWRAKLLRQGSCSIERDVPKGHSS